MSNKVKMGDSIKSSNSDVDEEVTEATPESNDGEIAKTDPQSQMDTKEFRNYISNHLEKHLETSIAKALHTALEQIHRNEEHNGQSYEEEPEGKRPRRHRYYKPREETDNPIPAISRDIDQQHSRLKNRRVRSHSTPHTLQIKDSSEDAETDEDSNEYKACPSASEPIALTLILVQALLIVLFAFFVEYDEDVTANPKTNGGNSSDETSGTGGKDPNSLGQYYSQYQDIQIMIFLGIGLLMTFLRKYGFSAIGFSLLAGTITVQWTILVRGFVYYRGAMIPLNILSLIYGDFAAAVVLITFGVVIGIATPLQLIFMTFMEVIFYVLNEYIGAVIFQAVDMGGSIFVHIFAAYFGLGVSRAMRSAKDLNTKLNGASYNSNIFCLIAVVFLWLFWPSFNSVLATGNDKHRIVINTMLSLFGSCIFAFATSALLNKNKFIISHIQNASLAGGVAVGAVADLMIRPFGALTIGSLGGLICVFGCQYISPLLTRKCGLHDTCGVHNLHGIPGLLSAFAGVMMAAVASECDYGLSLYLRYPARAPLAESSKLLEIQQLDSSIEGGLNRSASEQAMYQLAAVGVTLLVSLIGGAITGLLMSIGIFGKMKSENNFNDRAYFEIEEDESQPIIPVQKRSTKVNGVGVTNHGFQGSSPIPLKKRSKYEF